MKHNQVYLRDGPLFFSGGIVIGKKIVCMRKNAEINCLPKGASGKIVCRDYLRYARFGEFLKKLSAQPEWRKKLAALNRWWRKISCLLEITIPPAGGNNGPSLKFYIILRKKLVPI